VYRYRKNALFALRKFRDCVIKGVSVKAKGLGDLGAIPGGGGGATVKDRSKFVDGGRVIVRNLSWTVDNAMLSAAFASAGTVLEVSIPTAAGGKKRGFGFVQFGSAEEALAAVEEWNAKEIGGRRVAVDVAMTKDKYQAKSGEGGADGDDGAGAGTRA